MDGRGVSLALARRCQTLLQQMHEGASTGGDELGSSLSDQPVSATGATVGGAAGEGEDFTVLVKGLLVAL